MEASPALARPDDAAGYRPRRGRAQPPVAVSERPPVRFPGGGRVDRAADRSGGRRLLRPAHGARALPVGPPRAEALDHRAAGAFVRRVEAGRLPQHALDRRAPAGARVPYHAPGGWSGALAILQLSAREHGGGGTDGFPAAIPTGVPVPAAGDPRRALKRALCGAGPRGRASPSGPRPGTGRDWPARARCPVHPCADARPPGAPAA